MKEANVSVIKVASKKKNCDIRINHEIMGALLCILYANY